MRSLVSPGVACLASSVFAGLRVVCLQSGCWFHSSVVGVRQRQPLHGRRVCRWDCCVATVIGMVVLAVSWCW